MRLAVAAGAAVVGLAFAGPALAAYNPNLIAISVSNAPGKPTTMILAHTQEASDDPTAKDTIYAAPGYGVNLTQPVGTKIGDVTARLILRDAGNAEVDVDGQVIADNPALHPSDPCAPGLHQAVWKLRIWRATFTPYTPGTPYPNPVGTTEGQALVPGRVSLTLAVKRLKHGVVLLQGRLLIDGQAFRGATVELYVPGKTKAVAKGKTNSTGRYSIRKRIKKKTRYHAEVFFIGSLASCPATPLPGVPQGCKTATVSFAVATKNVLARPRR